MYNYNIDLGYFRVATSSVVMNATCTHRKFENYEFDSGKIRIIHCQFRLKTMMLFTVPQLLHTMIERAN